MQNTIMEKVPDNFSISQAEDGCLHNEWKTSSEKHLCDSMQARHLEEKAGVGNGPWCAQRCGFATNCTNMAQTLLELTNHLNMSIVLSIGKGMQPHKWLEGVVYDP